MGGRALRLDSMRCCSDRSARDNPCDVPILFTAPDLTRAIKAALRAGLSIASVRIEPNGAIVILPAVLELWHHPRRRGKPMGCAVTDRLRFVNVQRGRDGVVRHWYFRRNGRRWRLPGNPYSDANARAEYTRLEQETDKESAPAAGTADRYATGSFGALVRDYLSSGTFREKKPSTRAEYRRVMEALAEAHGAKPVRLIERRHIRGFETSVPIRQARPIPSSARLSCC